MKAFGSRKKYTYDIFNIPKKKLFSTATFATGAFFGIFLIPAQAFAQTPTNIAILEQQIQIQQKLMEAQAARLNAMQAELNTINVRQINTPLQTTSTSEAGYTPSLSSKEIASVRHYIAEESAKQATLKSAPPGSLSFVPQPNSLITIYGGLDMGMFYQSASGGPNLLYHPYHGTYLGFMGNAEYAPNLGIKGTYQLRPGWTAGFNMAGGITYSGTGAMTYSPFNHSFNIEIGSPYGKLTIGEQYDPAWGATIAVDPQDARQTFDAIAAAWSFGQGTSLPQGDFSPTDAFGYTLTHGPIRLGVLYKPATNANASTVVPFEHNMSVGQQESAGITYNDGQFIFSAAYLQKYGSTAEIHGVDVRNWTVGAGYHIGKLLFRGGVTDVNLPHGVTAAPLGTAEILWPRIQDPQEIMSIFAGVKYHITPTDQINASFYHSVDRRFSKNNADTYALDYDHSFTPHLSAYVSGAVVRASAHANPLTSGTSPSNNPLPGGVTIGASGGLRLRF